jgi:hypothetical protein
MGRDLNYDLIMIDILSERVELAKHDLAVNKSASVLLSSSEAVTLSLHVTQDEFNFISKSLFNRVLSRIVEVVNKAKVLDVHIDEVVVCEVHLRACVDKVLGPAGRRFRPNTRTCPRSYTSISSGSCAHSGTTCNGRCLWRSVFHFHSVL